MRVEAFCNEEVRARLRVVPVQFQEYLDMQPTKEEIRQAVMSLGPDKAPGPDGYNARIIQTKWDLFGPAFTKEVENFFLTGHMPPNVARSNLVLIPKREDACKVQHFRPVSVCNMLYKTISKILAARMKPFMDSCVSTAQSTFVPGRDISANIILLREILHSFQMRGYKGRDFCLKADLSKAFDRMDWDYLQQIIPLYGFPPNLTRWVMTCVRSARFTVVLNGHGDGFFTPECGLRQGCALSPYLFILGMDLLSRKLAYHAEIGELRGLRLTARAKPITNSIYADDLLIFGSATVEEASTVMHTLTQFSQVSGQIVGPEKSNIWYSSITSQEERDLVAMVMGVPLDATSEMYLGAPIRVNAASFDFLIEKFSMKLQSWKSKILSPAGRLVLIQSVLQSLPIYYMSTVLIPQKVIKALNDLMRRFMWGAMDKDRYLAYVAWDRICMPFEKGGLGIRSLKEVNEALVLKSLWRLAQRMNIQWIQVVTDKYLPRSLLWHSRRTYNCSVFWKGLMKLREKLTPMLRWEMGNGANCTIFAQPWFPGATNFMPTNRADYNLTISDLVAEDGITWDIEKIVGIFGYQPAIQIVQNVRPPRTQQEAQDCLRFSKGKNGDFSVKEAYKALKQPMSEEGITGSDTDPIWRIIWKRGYVLPRVRLFIWKLVQKALPLGKTLLRRTSRGDAMCWVCANGEEDEKHLGFGCDFARACWLAGPMALRTEEMGANLSLKEILIKVASDTREADWGLVANSLWALWKCRNGMNYQAKNPDFNTFITYLNNANAEALIGAAGRLTGCKPAMENPDSLGGLVPEYICFTDGSWKQPCRGFWFLDTKEGRIDGVWIGAN